MNGTEPEHVNIRTAQTRYSKSHGYYVFLIYLTTILKENKKKEKLARNMKNQHIRRVRTRWQLPVRADLLFQVCDVYIKLRR